MVKDHGKRLKKLEEWKDKVVDDRLTSIENKLDTFIAGHDGKDELIDEKFKNILEKIDQISLWKK